MANRFELVEHCDELEAILNRHKDALGDDIAAYRNHCYRVLNYCAYLKPDADLELYAIAVAFHDLGIWTQRTFDYLEPSIHLANMYLNQIGHGAKAKTVTEMIDNHHKILPLQSGINDDVEVFRKADWVDVTFGVISHGVDVGFKRKLNQKFPNNGFHKFLLKQTLKRFLSHPLNPLPMFKL